MMTMLRLPEDLEERFQQIQKKISLYDEIYGAPIRRGVTSLVLSEDEHGDLKFLQENLEEYRASSTNKDNNEIASQLKESIDLILKNSSDIRSQGGSHDIDLRTYPTRVGDLPYFVWKPDEYFSGKRREIGAIYYPPSDVDFGMKIIWDKQMMWTDLADAALLVDSNYNFLEGFMYHQWVWFREGRVFHPSDVKINRPTYRNLDHAIESMSTVINVPANLLRYIIVNSNLPVKQKKSIGFDRPEFTGMELLLASS